MVLLSGSLALGIFFCGFGMQKLFALNYRINKSVMGNDTQFLLKLYAPLELILLFTIILLLLYYVKCSTNNYEMLVTLGMEKKLSVYIRVIESIFGGIIIGIAGIVAGKLLLNIFVYVLEKWANLSMDIQSIGADCYIKALSITGVIYIFSCMFTRDIYGSFQMGNSVDKRDIQERMPKRFLKVLTAIGMVLCVSQLYRYSKIYNFESFYIIGVFLGGLLVLFRYMSAYLCIKRRKKISYLYKMIEENKMWNKSLTQTGYLYALTVVHLCVLFIFSFQIISIILVVKPQQLYPYDIVCIADDGDRSVFNKMAIDYKVNIEEYPMVRISNFDCTERLESFGEKTVQGQQIGISESTYHKLKEKLDQSYVPKPLGLSKDGKNIYIVHQQDMSIKAQPTDFWMHSRKPLLHIGQPCTRISRETALTALRSDIGYYFKEIRGEEIESLIGVFGQGIKENIIVLSDNYFDVAQEWWKTRNIYTGREIENPKERIPDVTIRQGPTKLVLINGVKKIDMPGIEKILKKYQKKHIDDEEYDQSIRSYYLKDMAENNLIMERSVKIVINILMSLYFFLIGVFLLLIKLMTEREENKNRNRFLKYMGMPLKEREKILFKENSKCIYISEGVALVSACLFSIVTFSVRLYPIETWWKFSKYLILFWSIYCLAYIVTMQGVVFGYIRTLREE